MATWKVFSAALAFMKADIAYLKLLRQSASYNDEAEPSLSSEEWKKIQAAKRARDELEQQMYAVWRKSRGK